MSLWFVIPVHGRIGLATICLQQIRRTCDALTDAGVDASAVVIADAENHGRLPELGFATVERDNRFLGARFNDGIQLACDPAFNPRPVDYVVPCGSDDWVDYRLFLDLPAPDTMVGFQHMCFVREDGLEMSHRHLTYPGGCGIRIWPRQLMQRLSYRPADEDRKRGCDTSILVNSKRAGRFRLEHRVIDPRQIVDWKSPGTNLNTYRDISARYRSEHVSDPFETLADLYPSDLLDEMAVHYGRVAVAA